MANIIIAGGGLVNKGAQAMTLICVCELKNRYPGDKIYLLVWNDNETVRKEHAPYDLEPLEIRPLKFSAAAGSSMKKAIYSLRYGETFRSADRIYRDARMLLDISGYALGSNWPAKINNDYLDNIEYALNCGVPVYLMPQSFGPFDFKDAEGKAIYNRIGNLLPKVNLACAREEEGFRALNENYSLKNLILADDMVLSSKITDYSGAMKEQPILDLPQIRENSMCLVPNERITDLLEPETTKLLYRSVIEAALERELNVYITYHSNQDRGICADLKKSFAESEHVMFLDRDFSCLEFNALIKKFRFMAGSRFHSIVHSLKNGIPCIALGWAAKYDVLMNKFNQGQYMFDVRNKVTADGLESAVFQMADRYQQEAETIRGKLPEVQKTNIFDVIQERSQHEN